MGLPESMAHDLVTRLVGELARATGHAYPSRYEALSLLRCSGYGHVVLEVADTGQGIAAEDLPQVWDELYRSPAARTVPGSGLGLPLVRAVVERHGGRVGVESRLGSGTVVRVSLPTGGPGGAQAAP